MFETILIRPLYNTFIYLIDVMPGGDMGLAIIVLTFLIRLLLYPVFTASIRTQMGMAAIQGKLEALKETHKNDKEQLARAQIALFKEHKVNPFAGIGALILQLGVIIALYFALFRENFPVIETDLLYSFVPVPEVIATNFFGILDLMTPQHLLLALLVGITQYLAIRLTISRTPITHAAGSDKEAVARMQQNLMLYFLPGVMAVTAYFFAGAIGLYFVASNLFSLGQEWLIVRKLAAK